MLNKIVENFYDEEFYKIEGLDDAVIGYDKYSMTLIYSVSKCLLILQFEMQEMSDEEVMEHFTYNIFGAGSGEKTPIWCWDNLE